MRLAAVFASLGVCACSGPVADERAVNEPDILLVTTNQVDSAGFDAWVSSAQRAIEGYYGTFPVHELAIHVDAGTRPGVSSGVTRVEKVPTIRIAVSPTVQQGELERDWTLAHEMIHLALPQLPPAHDWLGEGTAVYVEPLARARTGLVDVDTVWAEMLADYAQGLPDADDQGLDLDRSWGRTYYGGAIFCLLADVEIRARTDNVKSLQDALRAVLAEIGNLESGTSIERVCQVGDRATGTSVLTDLYAKSSTAPFPKELESTWRSLGVRMDGNRVTYDERAPLANVRRALVLGTR